MSAGQLDVKLVDSMKLQLNDTKDKYLVSGGPNVQYVLFTRLIFSLNAQIHNTQSLMKIRNNPFYNLHNRNSEELSASGFNSSNPTKIIIHGYTSSITEVVFTSLRDGFPSKFPF